MGYPQQHNLYLELSYEGTRYSGSQVQQNSITIQELLDKNVAKIFDQKIKSIFSGRTDSGVHAICQPVNIPVSRAISPKNVLKALNSLLPKDIRVTTAEYRPLKFQARYDAKQREYRYNIFCGPSVPVFLQNYVWHIKEDIAFAKLKKASKLLIGTMDFSGFTASGSYAEDKKRSVRISSWSRTKVKNWPGGENIPGYLLTYRIAADGFLYHMVRNLVSTQVDIGLGKHNLKELSNVIKHKDRAKLKSITAPANGLVLYKVKY